MKSSVSFMCDPYEYSNRIEGHAGRREVSADVWWTILTEGAIIGRRESTELPILRIHTKFGWEVPDDICTMRPKSFADNEVRCNNFVEEIDRSAVSETQQGLQETAK